MKKSLTYLMYLTLLFLTACEKAEITSEVMPLENDFIEAEIDGKMVRFDGFRFGQDASYRASSEIKFTRTTKDGLEDITINITGLDLSYLAPSREISFGRSNDQGSAEGPQIEVELVSREQSGDSHCPYLEQHTYDLEGTLYIDDWSAETGILEGRFEAEKVGRNFILPEPGSISENMAGAIELFIEDMNREIMLREGHFRVWLQTR